MSDAQPILDVRHLSTRFNLRGKGLFAKSQTLKAVNDVSFSVREGETLGVVGESGCGKSTLGRSILRLIEPTEGSVVWQGRELTELSAADMRRARRDLSIIFQDPIASLDPRMTVGDIIAEPLRVAEPNLGRAERRARVERVMAEVGLVPEMINRYPHEFSGGQAQRIGIARAIVTEPKLIVCDEPVSALDVSIQAQIVNLLRDLRERRGLTLIFISHDLSVVRLVSDRILVLYLGRVVETGPRAAVFERPAHPYSRALLSAAPIPDPAIARTRKRTVLQGDPPSPVNPPSGCAFRTRCPIAEAICASDSPQLRAVEAGHEAACHFAGEEAARRMRAKEAPALEVLAG
ncbi:ABC transporter ATP-binding protein [Aureimonas jatrophae]|uniref:Oligopeptide transport system ATP-binding protein n=1 Tax=Aureimonas jatrophae TaxID=1166073 RepID=A0A1H0IRM2_9HYPH|nr:oligopeptide/dipeptide ABC transporter ATP-binding protein [Aureimonas jatrophae]MBB3952323.1 oligopeptide transport system ATP-binding protein [Aureimonas jatrophae]SDO34035.1 oligopeptide transport system ATP-binding protein [Aureimonas jatrophae]